ncbi:hypothetical protein A3732_22600 [Oleiphilus sp. HI0050]|jgi:hypothetical protein|nr:hypothetical protein A3732_22600 [Oleiphilus sp. HI0050]KZZ33417.1 hypothetical protein A3756_19175 [Oleiphilus sp. HI0086]
MNMNMNKFIAVLALVIPMLIPNFSLAEEPQTKEEQCAQYGSYQDSDGIWQTCDPEETESTD